MTAAVPGAAPRPGSSARRLVALVGQVPRACLPARRRAVMALPVATALLFGMVARALDGSAERDFATVADAGILGLVLPLGSLVVGDAVLGADVRAGTFATTWLSPARFGEIAVARWAGGWLLAAATLAPAGAAAAWVAGAPGAAGPLALALVAGTAAHVALFTAVGAWTRRAAVWSLAIVFLGERLLGAALTGVAQLSPTWEARQVFAAGVGHPARDLLRDGIPQGGAAVARLGLVAAVCVALTAVGLRRLRLSGSRD